MLIHYDRSKRRPFKLGLLKHVLFNLCILNIESEAGKKICTFLKSNWYYTFFFKSYNAVETRCFASKTGVILNLISPARAESGNEGA